MQKTIAITILIAGIALCFFNGTDDIGTALIKIFNGSSNYSNTNTEIWHSIILILSFLMILFGVVSLTFGRRKA